MINYYSVIKDLNLKNVSVLSVTTRDEYIELTITGGKLNNWNYYLYQIIDIIDELDCWIIELINDVKDDSWMLKVGTKI